MSILLPTMIHRRFRAFLLLFTHCIMPVVAGVRIAVVGGGASGIFSSIAAAEAGASVTVMEATSQTLHKVKISGGGRCNVLHDTSKPTSLLLNGYPRGKKELNGLLNKGFPPQKAQQWFEQRGVTLKTEEDGRMFPTTDSSDTIVQTLLNAARDAGVNILSRCKVESVVGNESSLSIHYQDKSSSSIATQKEDFDAVILATGSTKLGYQIAQNLGHTIVPPVPSLFTLSAKQDVATDGLLHELAGVSVPNARVSFRIPGQKKPLQQEGPLLITHHGLSGPAALRLSAFGARAFCDSQYRGDIVVHWACDLGTVDDVAEQIWQATYLHPKRKVSTICPIVEEGSTVLPKRLWAKLVQSVGLEDRVWAETSKKLVRQLAQQICECSLTLTGKGTFKEEFVTAGGVSLKEIDMKTMQSKLCDGLYFCGELIDVDGVTGGYNFMNCWGTGYLAGMNAAVQQQKTRK